MTLLVGVGLIFISLTGFSQTTLKIGHVDIAEILAALPARDSAAAVIEKETKEMQSTYDDMTAVYNRMLDDYEKEQSTFSEVVKKSKEAELLDKEKGCRSLNRMLQPTCKKEIRNLFNLY